MLSVEPLTCTFRPGQMVHAFLLLTDDATVLIDTATAQTLSPALEPALARHGRRPSDLTHVLLTHGHWDHAGGAAGLARAGAQVWVHPLDAPYLSDPGAHLTGYFLQHLRLTGQFAAAHKRAGLLGGAMPGVLAPQTLHPVYDDATLELGSVGLRVLHTPGHCGGHVAYWHEATGTLFTGDTVQGDGPGEDILPLYDDALAYPATLARLAALRPRAAYVGHPYWLGGHRLGAELGGDAWRALLTATARVLAQAEQAVCLALLDGDDGFLAVARRSAARLVGASEPGARRHLTLDASGLPPWFAPALLSHYRQQGGLDFPPSSPEDAQEAMCNPPTPSLK